MNSLALGALALSSLTGSDSSPSEVALAFAVPITAIPSAARIAWGDFDADGLADALMLPAHGAPVLLENRGDGTFADRSELLSDCGGPLSACAWGDFDADGYADLLIVDGGGAVRLMRNEGAEPFLDVTDAAGLAGVSGVLAVEWSDYDGDAQDDLILHTLGGARIFHNGGGYLAPSELPSSLAELAVPLLTTVEVGRESSASGALASERDSASGRLMGPAGAPQIGSASGSVFGSVTPGGVVGAAGVCAPTLSDASGGCLSASSVPLLGALYPLSEELFVDLDGSIGMGTTNPLAPVHLAGVTATNLNAAALSSDELVLDAGDAVLGIYSTGGGSWGSAIVLGEIESDGDLSDKWSFVRGTSQGGGRLKLTNGSDPQYWVNPTVMSFEPSGHVGIGLDDPLFPFHVTSSGGTTAWIDGDLSYSLIVNNSDTQNPPLAAFLGGALDVGVFGSFGLPVRKVHLAHDPGSDGGVATVFNGTGVEAVKASVDSTDGGYLRLRRADGSELALLDGNSNGHGYLSLRNSSGQLTSLLHGGDSTNAGYLQLFDANGALRIWLDGSSAGKGRITCDVLEIKGGADLVESFDTREQEVEPGTVLVIDAERPGALRVADTPYDTRVAGVVSGAGGVDAGLSLGQDGVSGDTPVALNGRVYVKASAENGPIRPGDRLTSAATLGHAMRVSDSQRADGAVIGKAMTSLAEGTGLVLVLVNLQ